MLKIQFSKCASFAFYNSGLRKHIFLLKRASGTPKITDQYFFALNVGRIHVSIKGKPSRAYIKQINKLCDLDGSSGTAHALLSREEKTAKCGISKAKKIAYTRRRKRKFSETIHNRSSMNRQFFNPGKPTPFMS